MKPGDLTIVNPARGRYNDMGGVMAHRDNTTPMGVWITIPFLVLAVFPLDLTSQSIHEHNVILLGANGAIGWLPDTWVTRC